MREPTGVRLIQACESLCDELRRRVGLTAFTIELDRASSVPLVIALRAPDPIAPADPRHDPRAPARLEIPVSDGERHVARVILEDARRPEYPQELRVASRRIVDTHATRISAMFREAAPA